MEPSVLAPWRDLAIILLVIEAALIVAAPGVALFFAVKGVRWVKRKVREPFRQAQVWSLRIKNGTVRATDKVAAVPIKLSSASTRATVTTRELVNYLIKG